MAGAAASNLGAFPKVPQFDINESHYPTVAPGDRSLNNHERSAEDHPRGATIRLGISPATLVRTVASKVR